MRELIKMVVVLTTLAALSGGVLAGLKNGTAAQIENQQLKFVKGPAIKAILEGASNDPIVDRFKIKDGDIERSFFVGKFDMISPTVQVENFYKGLDAKNGKKLVVFEQSAHCPMMEENEKYQDLLVNMVLKESQNR